MLSSVENCEQPYFYWNDKYNTCGGCDDTGEISEQCKQCEGYFENVKREMEK